MTTQFPAQREPEAGWHVDPDDPHVMRWWDGTNWGNHVKPRLVVAAEDQTRILNDQTRLLVDIRNDVNTMRTIMVVWVIVTVVGLLGYLIASVGSNI